MSSVGWAVVGAIVLVAVFLAGWWGGARMTYQQLRDDTDEWTHSP